MSLIMFMGTDGEPKYVNSEQVTFLRKHACDDNATTIMFNTDRYVRVKGDIHNVALRLKDRLIPDDKL